MRLFIGIFPPAEAVADLAAVVDRLAAGKARITAPERRHITLAFLGEVPDSLEQAAVETLAAVAPVLGEVQIAGGGRFGRGRSTVLWAGIAGDLAGLARLNRTIRRELRARRLHPDDKRFHPHLTIARAAHAVPPDDLAALRAYRGPAWLPTEVVLVRSELGPQPAYHRLASTPIHPR